MRAASPKSATTVRKTPLGSFWIRQFCGSGREGEGKRGGREEREGGREGKGRSEGRKEERREQWKPWV